MKKQITVLCAALLCLLAAFAPGAAAAPALTPTEAFCIIDAAEYGRGTAPGVDHQGDDAGPCL